jgi:hypothetical protein
MKRRAFITLLGGAGGRLSRQHVIRSLCALCGCITRGEARGRKGKFSNTPRFANATTLFFDPVRPLRLPRVVRGALGKPAGLR